MSMNSGFLGKKVLVFGLGLNQGGVGTAKFFAKAGAKVRVTDLKSKEVLSSSIQQLNGFPEIEYTLGEHKYEDINWADLIIKNPGVKPGNEYIEYAKSHGKRVETDMGIFLEYINPKQVIGVTGTKGKSTTASLIDDVLKDNKEVMLAGNIGTSVLDMIPQIKPESLIVLEISSFQLESWNEHKISPHIAVITNIYPDHLNYYKSMDEYIAAKKWIALHQTKDDLLFIRKEDSIVDQENFLQGIKSQIIRFSRLDLPKDFQPNLQGVHNLENMAAALAVAKTLKVPEDQALKIMRNFKGVDFRMQLIYDKGIKIYNDTTATGPEPAIRALKTLPNSIVITGGMNKGMDYSEYAKVLSESAKEVFFLEGDSTNEILSLLQESNLPIHGPYNNLEKLLEDVKKVAKPGDTILFSPAATSFNMFQNEFDRGKTFNKLVERIFK